MAYAFEWDYTKAKAIERKHGVSFSEASTAFGDPLGLLFDDLDHSADEARYLLLATSSRGRLLVVAFAERPPWTRLVSARLATRHERRSYEEG